MNNKIITENNKALKHTYILGINTSMPSVLDGHTEEPWGMADPVLMCCADCNKYPLGNSRERGVSKGETMETLGIATLVGGTIIPVHLRTACDYWKVFENVGQG